MTQYPLLFRPLTIRGRTIPNRIVSTPHATGWDQPHGRLTDAEVDYHVRKAAGGCGLVMTFGSASVDPSTAASYGAIALWDDVNEPALRRLAEGVHAHGGIVMSQMTHMGRRGDSRASGIPVRGPSDIPEPEHREVPVPLETDEIKAIVQRFVIVAQRLEACGWDGCEVTSFGHLIEQFWDPRINTRTDEYGGSLENRMRFGKEVVAAVRAHVSEDFIVGFRMTIDHRSGTDEVGIGPDELSRIAIAMAATGDIDLLSLTGGAAMTKPALSHAMGSDFVPPVTFGELAAAIKGRVDIPVLLAGRIIDGDHAEQALRDRHIDLVAMTRALIADPDVPHKLIGRQRIRPCIGINQGCIGRLYQGLPVLCTVNPAIREPALEHAKQAGTPAAKRGHQVIVLDDARHAGGRARLNAEFGWRPSWQKYLDFLIAEAVEVGVELRLETSATAHMVLDLGPDEVVLATGSHLRDSVRARSGSPVHDADDIIVTTPTPQGLTRTVIIDEEGGFCGPTAALALAGRGWEVTIATPLAMVAGEVDGTLLPFVHRKLELVDPDVIPNVRFLRAADDRVELENVLTGTRTSLEDVGLTVIAGNRQARNGLRADLAEARPDLPVHLIGDAISPRGMNDATAEGARIGSMI